MSTILNTNGDSLQIPKPHSFDLVFDIVTADWNRDITYALRDGAAETLRKAGIPDANIRLHSVPGTVELINAAAALMHGEKDDALSDGIIVIGCVIRGDTPHFDYVCMQAAQGVAILNAEGGIPVTFGVLTVDNLRQAKDRAGGIYGNKGAEAACVAISMANFHAGLKE